MKIGTLNINKLNLNQRKFTISEIGRGTGIIQSKKGKGSYKRKNKHKKHYRDLQDDNVFYYKIIQI